MTSTQAERRDFNKEAAQWDANSFRVKLAQDVSAAMMRELKLSKDMTVLDFGCGTGLVTLAAAASEEHRRRGQLDRHAGDA